MRCVAAKTPYVPHQNLRAVAFGLAGQRRIGAFLLKGNCVQIALIGASQRLLRRQLQLRQQESDRRDAQFDSEFPLDQQRNDRRRPQSKVQP